MVADTAGSFGVFECTLPADGVVVGHQVVPSLALVPAPDVLRGIPRVGEPFLAVVAPVRAAFPPLPLAPYRRGQCSEEGFIQDICLALGLAFLI